VGSILVVNVGITLGAHLGKDCHVSTGDRPIGQTTWDIFIQGDRLGTERDPLSDKLHAISGQFVEELRSGG